MTLYDETMWVPWWATVCIIVSAIIIEVPIWLNVDGVVKVVPGVAILGALLLLARWNGNFHVRIDDEFLSAGPRVTLRLADIEGFTVMSKRDNRNYTVYAAFGPRPFWMPRALRVEAPGPPKSYRRIWYIGTRHPDELAQVLEQAVMKARGRF